MEIKECSPIGMEVLEGNHPLIIGISINNSYFSLENLEKILIWATSNQRPVYVMIPDKPAVHTMVALGKSVTEAERIARLKSNALENKCKDIIQHLDLCRITIIRWKDIVQNANYQKSLIEVQESYKTDSLFHGDLRSTTISVLKNGGLNKLDSNVVDIGVQFLFQELAFIARASLILEKGKIAYVYHKTMDVLSGTIAGSYSFKADTTVGLITAE